MSIVTIYEKTTYDIDWEALAEGVEKLIIERMNYELEVYADDKVIERQMFVQDAADGLKVCHTMLETQNWFKVKKSIDEMDTAARDYIYTFIEIVAGPEFFEVVGE